MISPLKIQIINFKSFLKFTVEFSGDKQCIYIEGQILKEALYFKRQIGQALICLTIFMERSYRKNDC